jgi:hypothetical protein
LFGISDLLAFWLLLLLTISARRPEFGHHLFIDRALDHYIIFNEKHLRKILEEYVEYYNNCRTHLSLDKNSPEPRGVEKPEKGKFVSIPKVGGLHHLYKRVA